MKTAALFALTLCTSLLWSQNLVENGSFENVGPCPIISNDIEDIATPWTSYFGTPDYFHQSCGFPGSPTTTNNALPFDGEGFMGINMYGDNGTNFNREYLHGELKKPLEAGKFYRVTFYVKPLNNDAAGKSYGINGIGMLITDTVVDTIPTNSLLDYKPQVMAVDEIIAESYWTAVCGVFKAKGGEKFITIGNFRDDISTRVVPLSGASNPLEAYYLIDYVELVENDLPQLPEDTIICIDQRIDLTISAPDVTVEWNTGFTGKNFIVTQPGEYSVRITTPGCSYVDTILIEPATCTECKMYIPNAFTPNGDDKNDKFLIQASCAEEIVAYRISIFDRWGRKVFESNSLNVPWDGEGADHQGVYTYTLEYTYPLYRKTQTLTKRGTITLLK